MEFSLDRDVLLSSLNHVQGIVEKKNTLQILSNVLIQADNSKLRLTSTDLDIIFIEEISNLVVNQQGSTTTSASILYDIVKQCTANSKLEFKLISESKLELKSENSKFNLKCLSPNDFPLSEEDFKGNEFVLESKKLLKLINKTKICISSDETRHYLSGIFFHKTKIDDSSFLTAAATDTHRLSISNIKLDSDINFESIIVPKKTIFQISSLLADGNDPVSISNSKSKIKFKLKNSVLISKVIDGKFPNYNQVIPKDNTKILEIKLKDFVNAVNRVVSVSSDKKEGVKMHLFKDYAQLSVNSPNSGDGTEKVKANFNSDEIGISFNSRYLMDVASQVEGEKMIFNLQDTASPAIVKDPSDPNSLYVVMPMKI